MSARHARVDPNGCGDVGLALACALCIPGGIPPSLERQGDLNVVHVDTGEIRGR